MKWRIAEDCGCRGDACTCFTFKIAVLQVLREVRGFSERVLYMPRSSTTSDISSARQAGIGISHAMLCKHQHAVQVSAHGPGEASSSVRGDLTQLEDRECASGACCSASWQAVMRMCQRLYAVQVSAHGPEEASSSGRGDLSRLEEGMQIRRLLQRNTEELSGVMRALNGEYIQPEAGGDLLRDGAGVLPTGNALLSLL